MSVAFEGDAAFRYTEAGQDYIHHLGAPLWQPMALEVEQEVYAWQSADRTTIRRLAIGSGVQELQAQIRYDGNPQSLNDFIAAARRGATLEYFPSLSDPSLSFPCVLMSASSRRQDPDFWHARRWVVDVVLRRIDGGTWQALTESPLFYWLAGNDPGGFAFARAGAEAWAPDEDGTWQESASGIMRLGWREIAGTITPVTPIELAATNDLLDSADVDPDDANWTESAAWTQAAATALFAGGVSQLFTSDGVTTSHAIYQATPTLVGTPVVVSWIVEESDALNTEFGLFDVTAGDWVIRGQYVWATGAVTSEASGAGSSTGVRATTLATLGPNGGTVVRLEAYATADNAGNAGRAYLYPVGISAVSTGTYVHHGQHEDGTVATSPIVTAGAADTRPLETFSADFVHKPQAMTVYTKHVEGATISIANGGLWRIGSTGSTNPRIRVFVNSGNYALRYTNLAGATRTSTVAAAPNPGQLCELLGVLNADGSVQLSQSIDAAAATTAAATTASAIDANAWAAGTFYFNADGTSNPGGADFVEVKVSAGVKSLAAMRAL